MSYPSFRWGQKGAEAFINNITQFNFFLPFPITVLTPNRTPYEISYKLIYPWICFRGNLLQSFSLHWEGRLYTRWRAWTLFWGQHGLIEGFSLRWWEQMRILDHLATVWRMDLKSFLGGRTFIWVATESHRQEIIIMAWIWRSSNKDGNKLMNSKGQPKWLIACGGDRVSGVRGDVQVSDCTTMIPPLTPSHSCWNRRGDFL